MLKMSVTDKLLQNSDGEREGKEEDDDTECSWVPDGEQKEREGETEIPDEAAFLQGHAKEKFRQQPVYAFLCYRNCLPICLSDFSSVAQPVH